MYIMVQAMINISEQVNQVLNIVKAKHNLRDKSQAIEKVILEFSSNQLETITIPDNVTYIGNSARVCSCIS